MEDTANSQGEVYGRCSIEPCRTCSNHTTDMRPFSRLPVQNLRHPLIAGTYIQYTHNRTFRNRSGTYSIGGGSRDHPCHKDAPFQSKCYRPSLVSFAAPPATFLIISASSLLQLPSKPRIVAVPKAATVIAKTVLSPEM